MEPRSSGTSAPPTPQPAGAPARSRTSRLAPGATGAVGATAAAGETSQRSVMSEATARREHSDRDMRSKRPPAMSFLLRMDTARRAGRVVSLLALDFVGVALAIFTALIAQGSGAARRERARRDRRDQALRPIRLPFDRAAVRPLGAVCGPLAAPGALADRRIAVPGRVRRADIRRGQRRTVLELLHLLRLAGVRAAVRVIAARRLRGAHRRGAASGGVPAQGDAGGHGRAHLRRRPRARRGLEPRAASGRRIHLAAPAGRERAALHGNAGGPRRGARKRTDRRGDHRRLGLPPGRGGRARRSLPPARRARADRALDDGDPDPPRRVRAGPAGAAVRARAARVRGHRLRSEAHVRPDRGDPAADRCSARCWR